MQDIVHVGNWSFEIMIEEFKLFISSNFRVASKTS